TGRPSAEPDHQAACQRAAPEHARRRRRVSTADLGRHIGGEAPRTLFDLAAQAVDQPGRRREREKPARRPVREQLDVAFENLFDRPLVCHACLHRLASVSRREMHEGISWRRMKTFHAYLRTPGSTQGAPCAAASAPMLRRSRLAFHAHTWAGGTHEANSYV